MKTKPKPVRQKEVNEVAALFQIARVDSGVDAVIEAMLPYMHQTWQIPLPDYATYEVVRAKLLALCKNFEMYKGK